MPNIKISLFFMTMVVMFLFAAVVRAQEIMITDVTFDQNRVYQPGDTVQITLRGEPGGTATFDVGNYATGLSMTEASPGVYVGSYMIPTGVNLSNVQITGHLQKNLHQAYKLSTYYLSTGIPQWPRTVITNILPNNGSYVTTNPQYIFVRYEKIDPYTQQGLRVYFDGSDITNFTKVGPDSASYSPAEPLHLGTHHLKFIGVNAVAVPFEHEMWFTVESQGAPVGNTSMSTTSVASSETVVPRMIPISSLTTIKVFDNISSQLNPGDTATVILLGRPNGIATFDIGPISTSSGANVGKTTGIPMDEITPGTYVGTYVVQQGDSFNSSSITGHLALPSGENLVAVTPTVNPPDFYSSYVPSLVYSMQMTPSAITTTEVHSITTVQSP